MVSASWLHCSTAIILFIDIAHFTGPRNVIHPKQTGVPRNSPYDLYALDYSFMFHWTWEMYKLTKNGSGLLTTLPPYSGEILVNGILTCHLLSTLVILDMVLSLLIVSWLYSHALPLVHHSIMPV